MDGSVQTAGGPRVMLGARLQVRRNALAIAEACDPQNGLRATMLTVCDLCDDADDRDAEIARLRAALAEAKDQAKREGFAEGRDAAGAAVGPAVQKLLNERIAEGGYPTASHLSGRVQHAIAALTPETPHAG